MLADLLAELGFVFVFNRCEFLVGDKSFVSMSSVGASF
jgi:hypothetical protein